MRFQNEGWLWSRIGFRDLVCWNKSELRASVSQKILKKLLNNSMVGCCVGEKDKRPLGLRILPRSVVVLLRLCLCSLGYESGKHIQCTDRSRRFVPSGTHRMGAKQAKHVGCSCCPFSPGDLLPNEVREELSFTLRTVLSISSLLRIYIAFGILCPKVAAFLPNREDVRSVARQSCGSS